MTGTTTRPAASRGARTLRGLSADEVARSRAEHGENRLSERKTRGFFSRFAANLGDPVIKVLLCALAANIIFTFRHTDWFETIGIAVSVLTATIVSTVSEYGGEAAYRRLSAEAGRAVCRVRRAGLVTEIPVTDVVVGDVVLLGAGESVPADGYIAAGTVRLDQSAMTGESREVEKRPAARTAGGGIAPAPDPASPSSALRGCLVLSGEAEMIVTAVGDATYLGGISGEVQEETRESPLKVRLSHLAAQISRLGYAAAAIVAAAYLFNAFVLDSGFIGSVILMKLSDTHYLFQKLIGALTLGLTVVVVAVPEGLPMMIAVVLSANIRRMVKAGVLVRKPVGIEAAGSMNILFTDKTGTLTEGRVSVGRIVTGDGGTAAAAARRLFNQKDDDPNGDEWAPGKESFSNMYGDVPDVPSPGMVKLTGLAAYIANNAGDDDEMYFIVGVTSSKTDGAYGAESDAASGKQYLDFVYNGKTIREHMATEGWKESADMCRAKATYLSSLHSPDEVPKAAEYLAGYGIELSCKPYSFDWLYRLKMIDYALAYTPFVNKTRDFLVKCTRDELWKLVDGNDSYGFIFYASDAEGRFVYTNADGAAARGDLYNRITAEPELKKFAVYSYSDIGLYDDLICRKK